MRSLDPVGFVGMLHNGFPISEYLPTTVLLHLLYAREHPPEKRWAACVALSGKPEPEAFDAIVQSLRAPEWELRRFALEAIQRHPRGAEAADHIVAALFDVDDLVRQTACRVCAGMRLEGAHDGILPLLKADNPDVRDMAANALAQLWDESDFDRMFTLYKNDQRRAVRIAAAKTLRKNAGPWTWRRLFNSWSIDREVRHRMWGCELAAKFGRRKDVPLVEPLLDDRNRNVRIAAEESIARLRAA